MRQAKNIVVARTFSKIYGMAGVRAGFVCAPAGLIDRMRPFRNNLISIIAMRDARDAGGIAHADPGAARHQRAGAGGSVCVAEEAESTLHRPAGQRHDDRRGAQRARVHYEDAAHGSGRRPAISSVRDNMLRVTIGTEAEIHKFQDVFWKVYQASG